RQVDVPWLVGLRVLDGAAGHGALDVECPGGHVVVLPPKGERLAGPHPGIGQREVEHRVSPRAVGLNRGEEGSEVRHGHRDDLLLTVGGSDRIRTFPSTAMPALRCCWVDGDAAPDAVVDHICVQDAQGSTDQLERVLCKPLAVLLCEEGLHMAAMDGA